jgi:hypothetical protein
MVWFDKHGSDHALPVPADPDHLSTIGGNEECPGLGSGDELLRGVVLQLELHALGRITTQIHREEAPANDLRGRYCITFSKPADSHRQVLASEGMTCCSHP